MRENINFIFDEEWEEQEKELRQILLDINDPELHKNVFILNSLMRAAAYNWVTKKTNMEKYEILGEEIKKPKYYQKMINIPAGREVLPIPIPSSETKVQPLHVFQEVPKFVQKTIIEPLRKPKRKRKKLNIEVGQVPGTRDLIIDRITKKVLASVDVNGEYTLHEPILDEVDIKVLQKIKGKRFNNMEKGWQLIKKYGKKYNIKPGHDSLIKYYVVNDVFGLGRIEALLHDKNVDGFSCDGSGKNIVVQLGDRKLKSNVIFNESDLKNFILSMAKKLDLKINKKQPTVNGKIREFEFTLSWDKENKVYSFMVKRI